MLIGGFALIYMRALIGIPACTFIPQCRSSRAAGALAVTFASGALAISAVRRPRGGRGPDALPVRFRLGRGALHRPLGHARLHRIALFAQNRAALSTVSDFAFTVSATAFVHPSAEARRERRIEHRFPRPGAGSSHRDRHRPGPAGGTLPDLGPAQRQASAPKLLPTMSWSIVSVTIANVQAQGPTFVIAAIAGPAGYAPIAATMAFFSPLRLAASALANMNQPDLAAAIKRSGDVRRLMAIQTAIIAAISLAYGGAMAVAFPLLTHRLLDGRFGDRAAERHRARDLGHRQRLGLVLGPEDASRNHAGLSSDQPGFGARCADRHSSWLRSSSGPRRPPGRSSGPRSSELVVFLGCWIFALRTLRVVAPPTTAPAAQSATVAIEPVPQDPVRTGAMTYPAPFVDPA